MASKTEKKIRCEVIYWRGYYGLPVESEQVNAAVKNIMQLVDDGELLPYKTGSHAMMNAAASSRVEKELNIEKLMDRRIAEKYSGWQVDQTGGFVYVAFKDFKTPIGLVVCAVVSDEITCVYSRSDGQFFTYQDYDNDTEGLFWENPSIVLNGHGEGESASLFSWEQLAECAFVNRVIRERHTVQENREQKHQPVGRPTETDLELVEWMAKTSASLTTLDGQFINYCQGKYEVTSHLDDFRAIAKRVCGLSHDLDEQTIYAILVGIAIACLDKGDLAVQFGHLFRYQKSYTASDMIEELCETISLINVRDDTRLLLDLPDPDCSVLPLSPKA
jgi:hypothetical protein